MIQSHTNSSCMYFAVLEVDRMDLLQPSRIIVLQVLPMISNQGACLTFVHDRIPITGRSTVIFTDVLTWRGHCGHILQHDMQYRIQNELSYSSGARFLTAERLKFGEMIYVDKVDKTIHFLKPLTRGEAMRPLSDALRQCDDGIADCE